MGGLEPGIIIPDHIQQEIRMRFLGFPYRNSTVMTMETRTWFEYNKTQMPDWQKIVLSSLVYGDNYADIVFRLVVNNV